MDVTNIGDRAGKEVVQLYVSDKTGSTIRPAHELKGFCKLALEPGEVPVISHVAEDADEEHIVGLLVDANQKQRRHHRHRANSHSP